MNNQWDQLIKAVVPLSFLAIWAITSLFNRESKVVPNRPPAPKPAFGPRPGVPPMRWPTPAPANTPALRRTQAGEDDIMIIQPDPARPGVARATMAGGPRRSARTRPAPDRKPDPTPARPRLGGVNQNVNQQLATPTAMTPLTTISPMTSSVGSDLAGAPSAPSKTTTNLTISALASLMNNPARLREAFLVNELLRPPVALRPRRQVR